MNKDKVWSKKELEQVNIFNLFGGKQNEWCRKEKTRYGYEI